MSNQNNQSDRSSQQASPRPTHVVTNILRRTDTQPPKILLVRRSQRVGSYQSHWAGVSGFVEQGISPDQQAYTEIREETTLQGEQIRMLKRGTVVEYIDHDIDRHWYIHPFLFEVETPDAIKTDWEATEMHWVDPAELDQYEKVPKFQEVYESAIHGESV